MSQIIYYGIWWMNISHALGLVSGVCLKQHCHPWTKTSLWSVFSTLLLFACALCCTKESVLCCDVYFEALCLRRLMRKHGDTLYPHSDWRAALLESGLPEPTGAAVMRRTCERLDCCAALWNIVVLVHKKKAWHLCVCQHSRVAEHTVGPLPSLPPYKSCFVM